jgi:hypothetical protein
MAEAISNPAFEQRLRRFSRVRRGLLNAALGYGLGAAAAAAGAAGLVLLNGWIANAWFTVGAFAVLVLGWLTLALLFLVRRERFRSVLHEAFLVEELAGDLNSRLVSAWDFLQPHGGLAPPPHPHPAAVSAAAGRDLDRPHEERLPRAPRSRRRRLFAAWALVFLALGATPWFGFGRAARHVRDSCFAVYEALFPVQYELQPAPGRHVVQLGTPVEVSLRFQRRGYAQVTLAETRGGPTKRTGLAVGTNGVARLTLKSDVEADVALTFEFGTRRTAEIRLLFTARPVLVNMQTELIYPAYTRLLPRTLEGIQTRIVGLAGTRVTLGLTYSKTLESAVITWDDGETLPLEVVGRFASTSLLHTRDRRASLLATDQHGLPQEFPLVLDFELQRDEPPQLVLPRHLVDDMPMLAEAVPLFGFGLRAQDDFGVTRCVLKWQKSTVDDPNNVRERGEIERLISPAQRKAVVSFEKAFAGLAVAPGDRIVFQVEAHDNRTPDAQVARTRPASLFVYQEELGGLSIRELGFGVGAGGLQARIPKSRRSTSVQEPEALRTREQFVNEYDAAVETPTVAPVVRGPHGQPTRDYFRLMSGVAFEKKEEPASEKK